MFSLWGKLKAGLVIAGAVIVAIGIALIKGRAQGKRNMEAEQQRKRDALQEEYDRIDAGPVAYQRLRDKSRGPGSCPALSPPPVAAVDALQAAQWTLGWSISIAITTRSRFAGGDDKAARASLGVARA